MAQVADDLQLRRGFGWIAVSRVDGQNGSGGPAGPSSGSDWQTSVRTQTNAGFASLKRNAVLNLVVRAVLYAIATAALGLAVGYAIVRGDDMVGVLISREGDFRFSQVWALTVPVFLLFFLALASLVAAVLIQTRGMRDFEIGLDGVSRLRREAEAGISRSRTSTFVLEEFMANARQTLRLQQWMLRSFFVLAALFAAAAVTQAIAQEIDLTTVALGGGSLLSVAIPLMKNAPDKVGYLFSDAAQTMAIVTNTAKQVNLIEELVYKNLELVNKQVADAGNGNLEPCWPIAIEGADKISAATREAVELIQEFTEPAGSPNEQEPAPPATPSDTAVETSDSEPAVAPTSDPPSEPLAPPVA